MIFNDTWEVLVTQRGEKAKNEVGMWDFPGGAVEFWERCEDAIKREIREELGIDIEIIELLEVVDHIIAHEGQHWVSVSYIAKYLCWEIMILEPEKMSRYEWKDITCIEESQMTLASRQNLRTYREKYQK